MDKINVIILSPSMSLLRHLNVVLEDIPTIEIMATSTSINKALNIILSDSPAVVLLDVNMSNSEKKTPLELILEAKSIPVIMIAEGTVEQSVKTVQAMFQGAVDFIKIESRNSLHLVHQKKEIEMKITNASKEKQFRASAQKEISLPIENEKREGRTERKVNTDLKESIIVIGASTGGPRALERILQGIPKGFSVPIFIVQHMPERFTKSLAERLNNIGNLTVKEASHGDIVQKGTVYLAPGNYHMKVRKRNSGLKIEITQEEEVLNHRPSINVLFDSAHRLKDIHKIAVVLTGMGNDGAEGIKKIKTDQDEAIIIAESRETAVIFGMPNAAIETNVVTEVLRLEHIAKALVEYTRNRGS